MLKLLFNSIKKIIFSFFLLYGYNLLVQPINLTIPINIFTVGAIFILGTPSLLALIFIFVFIY